MNPNIPDPFADLPIDPATKQAAYAVRDQMHGWIDSQVARLKAERASQAQYVVSSDVKQLQSQLYATVQANDQIFSAIVTQIKAFRPAIVQADFDNLVNTLQTAIDAHQQAVEQQKAQIQQVGQTVGALIQKAITMAA